MRRGALGFIFLFVVASACSLGPKQDWGDAMRDAFDRATEEGTAKVNMAVDVKVIETNIRQTPVPLVARLRGVADFRGAESRLVDVKAGERRVIFDDLVTYLPRSSASIGAGTRKQRWARFDFEREPSTDLDDTDRRLAVGAGLISPVTATEVLQGVLTGSIEREGAERAGGVEATHYTARLSLDAATREVDEEDRREGLLRLFDTLGVQEDVFPGEVWLDADGLVRKIVYVLRQQKDRVNAFEMKATWEFSDYGVPVSIALPARGDVIRSGRFREFIVEFIRAGV